MRTALTLALTAMVTLAGCVAPAAPPPEQAARVPPRVAPPLEPSPPRPLAELIAGDPRLSRFRALAAAGDLPALIAGRGGVTILAPTDDAFARLAPGTVETLLLPGNRPSLRHLLRFWSVPTGGWSKAYADRAAGADRASVPTLDAEALAMREVSGEQSRPSPTRLVDAAGRAASIAYRPATEGGGLAELDRVIAPRSIEPATPVAAGQ